MARILNQGVYPLKTPISLAGFLIGTDPEDSNRTKNFKIGDLVTFLSSLGLQDGTLKGEIVWTTGRTFITSDLEFFINDLAYTTLRSTVTLDPADTSLPRIDLITVDTNGLVSAQTGVPAATPIEPLIEDPTTTVKLTSVRLEALATVPTGITKDLMYDENAGTGGGEWDVTPTVGSTGFFDLASPLDPNTGTVSILLLSSSPTGDSLSFSPGVTLDIVDFTNIHFYIKTTAVLDPTAKIRVSFYNGSTEVSSKVTITPGSYSLGATNTSTYQSIILPKDDFSFNDTQYTSIVFAFEELPKEAIYFDTFNILGGINNPPRYGTFRALSDVEDNFIGKTAFIPVIDPNETAIDFVSAASLGIGNLYNIDGTVTASENRVVTVPATSTLSFDASAVANSLRFILNTPPTVGQVMTASTVSGDVEWQDGSSGLEAINEGNGTGWRLIGTPAANVGNIGFHAIDMGEYYSPSTTEGALGTHSFIGNGDSNSIASGNGTYGAFTLGGGANSISASSSSVGAGALGNFNVISNGYGAMALGGYNTINQDGNGFGLAAGMGNDLAEVGTSAIGIALDSRGRTQHAVGASNTIWGGSATASDRPIFTVGNGTYTTPANAKWVAIARSDAFVVKFNGEPLAPSLSITQIDAEATGKILITKEYLTRGYTVGTLPVGTVGFKAHVTDALAPTFGATVVGGGAVTIPVFFDGTNWIVA